MSGGETAVFCQSYKGSFVMIIFFFWWCNVQVQETDMKEGRVRVLFTLFLEPDMSEVAYSSQVQTAIFSYLKFQKTSIRKYK